MDNLQIILGPVISEKSIANTAANRYTFYVAKKSSKQEIAKAVEENFKVNVLDVKVVNIRGKKVTFGKRRIAGKKVDTRKAMVTIKAEQKIDIFDLGQTKEKNK